MKLIRLFHFFFLFFLISCATESTDIKKTAIAFEENFGFKPSKEIKEIKVKNFALRDAVAHWMSFTYESNSFERIIENDQPLKIALKDSSEYDHIINELTTGANIPKWFDIRNVQPNKIYFKKDFLNHTYSEYYLLVDSNNKMVYLMVSYFD